MLTNNKLDVIIIIESEREVITMRRGKEIQKFIIGLVAFCFAFVLLPGIAGYFEHHYTRQAEVVEVRGDVVLVKDTCGFEWEFYGNDYEVGQQVKMKMFTNYTHDIIFDDEIEKVEIRD